MLHRNISHPRCRGRCFAIACRHVPGSAYKLGKPRRLQFVRSRPGSSWPYSSSAGLADLAGLFAARGSRPARRSGRSPRMTCASLGLTLWPAQAAAAAPASPRPRRRRTPTDDGETTVPAPLAIAAAEQALQRSRHAGGRAVPRPGGGGARPPRRPCRRPTRCGCRLLIARSSISRVQQGIASDEAGRLGRQVLELARKLRETQERADGAHRPLYPRAGAGGIFRRGQMGGAAERARRRRRRTTPSA